MIVNDELEKIQQLPTGWMIWGSISGGGKVFHNHCYQPCGSPSVLYNGYCVSPGGKVRHIVNHQPPSSSEVKEGVQLYITFTSVPSWHVVG